MNFKQATDALLESVTLEDLARELGVSLQSVRQARLADESTGHRAPPPKWEVGVLGLARQRIARLERMVKQLK